MLNEQNSPMSKSMGVRIFTTDIVTLHYMLIKRKVAFHITIVGFSDIIERKQKECSTSEQKYGILSAS